MRRREIIVGSGDVFRWDNSAAEPGNLQNKD